MALSARSAVLLALILVLRHFDGRKGRMIRTDNLSLNLTSRLILLLLPILVFALYCIHVKSTDSLANKFSRAWETRHPCGIPCMTRSAMVRFVAFTRQLNPKIMDKPSNYSEGDHEEGRRSLSEGSGDNQRLPHQQPH